MFCQALPCIIVLLAVAVPRISAQVISIKSDLFFNVEESAKIGDVIGQFTVTGGSDLDIVSNTDYVKLNVAKKPDGSYKADVILNIELDHDFGKDSYPLSFAASDSQSSKTKTIQLVVQDVNDEAPVWSNRPYTVDVKEDAAVNSVIYNKIKALDPDLYDTLTYTLSTDGDSPFYLDEKGDLLLNSPLDFETNSFYQYSVTVKDKVNHTDTAEVFIRVEDVQDTPPEFLKETYSFTLSENTKPVK